MPALLFHKYDFFLCEWQLLQSFKVGYGGALERFLYLNDIKAFKFWL